MKTMPNIMTGKSAKEICPNMVEWSRHSSFIMRMKSSGMMILPDEGEEELGEMRSPSSQIGNRSCMEQFPRMQDRKRGTDLLGDLEDVGREEDRLSFPDIL